MQKGFWEKLALPIVGLSPMDGVTDAPMRFISKKYGQADVVYTEFVSAEGLWRIQKRGEVDNRIWKDLKYDIADRPVVAQLFGSDPESFYMATKIVCGLGFDGVDINMGCPSPGLEKRGGGAGLIRNQSLTAEVIAACRRGVKEFALENKTTEIPVTLKTRVGSTKPDESWWKFLASQEMPLIAMHGRTFKQLYSGYADWSLLLKAAEIIREAGTLFLANGDVVGINGDIVELSSGEKLEWRNKIDGVLIGRKTIGNPWVLRKDQKIAGENEKLEVLLEHARKFEEMFPGEKFFIMRKHLGGYVAGFSRATELRRALVLTESADQVEKIVREYHALL